MTRHVALYTLTFLMVPIGAGATTVLLSLVSRRLSVYRSADSDGWAVMHGGPRSSVGFAAWSAARALSGVAVAKGLFVWFGVPLTWPALLLVGALTVLIDIATILFVIWAERTAWAAVPPGARLQESEMPHAAVGYEAFRRQSVGWLAWKVFGDVVGIVVGSLFFRSS